MLDDFRKKLLFRAWHRGTREMDLIMGRFAEAHLAEFSEEQVKEFEGLLLENDPDIYNWLTGQSVIPDGKDSPMLRQMMQFYKMAA